MTDAECEVMQIDAGFLALFHEGLPILCDAGRWFSDISAGDQCRLIVDQVRPTFAYRDTYKIDRTGDSTVRLPDGEVRYTERVYPWFAGLLDKAGVRIGERCWVWLQKRTGDCWTNVPRRIR